MVYFFHHYELPVIMQQVQLQQLLIRSRQQQNQQPANQNARPVPPTTLPFAPFNPTATVAANVNAPPTQPPQAGDDYQERAVEVDAEARNNDNNNNTNNNLLNNVGVFINVPVYVMRALNMFGNIRNILTNGIVHNINNNINNNQMRVINLRNNLRQINLGSIEIRPISIGGSTGGVNGSGDGDISSDTRTPFQRNFEENNFQLTTDGTGPGHGDVGGLTTQQTVDTPAESVIADTDAEPPKSPHRIDVIHDNGHNDAKGDTTVDEAYKVQLIEKGDIVVDSLEEATTTDPTTEGDVTITRSNEMSADLFLLRQNVTRADDNTVTDSTAQQQHKQLFTQDSTEEMCSNKGDTENYSVVGGGSKVNDTKIFDGRALQCDGIPTGTAMELSHRNGNSSSISSLCILKPGSTAEKIN